MSKELEKHGIEVDAYRSPEDDILVIYIDTPGIDENEKGPLLRLYLNDDPAFENPAYPGAKEERWKPIELEPPKKFAEMSWCVGDVTSLDEWDPEWDDNVANQFLEQNGNALRDRLCQVGFKVLDDLLSGWEPEETDE